MGEYINSQQVRFDKSTVSCGILNVHHLPRSQPSKNIVFSILTQLYHKAQPRPSAWVMFSDVVPEDATKSTGQLLATSIAQLFGPTCLVAGPPKVNPRTGNVIKWWMWDLNHEHLRKWYQDELANRITEE